ncbi:16S rRNA (guanine(527)-N(7))-methyltransferase RsmG [Thermophagus sp. OGC60D27]|uniref:16S rRNA (guanine(527)-N(7))-methyltransferase RsmG n=1 Tax=Thermophagus sp. OGC60D27 TaxID=3458415 RepID=UPI0040380B52
MDLISKYFPNLTILQKNQFAALGPLYKIWNSKINVISRKDMDHFYLHHVLHSLSIAKFLSFNESTKIIDVGTGGGFPGIPLSILFPNVQFVMLDSVGKKIKVVNEVIREINLNNAEAVQCRSENFKGQFDFIISRAVTKLPDFVKLTRHLINHHQQNAVPNGIIYLKGGNIESEIHPFRRKVFTTDIRQWFEEPFFETKKLIHLPL